MGIDEINSESYEHEIQSESSSGRILLKHEEEKSDKEAILSACSSD